MTETGGYIRSNSGRRIPLFNWEPCDWYLLVDQQLIIPSVLKLQSYLLECQLTVQQICMGMQHSVILPFGLSVMTDLPFCHPKNPMIPPPLP